MSNSLVTIEKADSGDLDRVEALLEAHDLPYQDVRTKSNCFFIAYSDTEFIGVGGVEIYGSNGLLRSVVIAESNRGQSYGTALCDALEAYARTNEVSSLHLLTTSAVAFFRQCGYEVIVRENVPSSIQRTTEFTELCPNSAICLKKRL
jgi:amino-acid N-acetyltransferase